MKKVLCILFISVLGLSINSSFAQYASISYYVVAHPDDWQLFMGVNAFDDISNGAADNSKKVVLIYTTAGDGNCTGHGLDTGYYVARMTGANRSVRFCADIHGKRGTLSSSMVTVHGVYDHKILQYKYKHVISYFLRLPDGCFEATGNSLSKLASGQTRSLEAVDNSTTYYGYKDLIQTIEKIIQDEGVGANDVAINCPDWDNTINIKDHPDHVETGKIASAIAAKMPCVNLFLFQGYGTYNNPPNLSPPDIAKEAALLCQVSFGLTHTAHGTEWDKDRYNGHVDWTNRNYFRPFISCDEAVAKNSRGTGVSYSDSANDLGRSFLKVFPNPAKSVINITYELMDTARTTIVIYDMFGAQHGIVVNEVKNKGMYTTSYDVSHLRRGNYTIYAKTAQTTKAVQFVKE